MVKVKHNFSFQDAQALAALVRSAPLQNMQAAEAVAQLLDRFAGFVSATLVRPAPKVNNDVSGTD